MISFNINCISFRFSINWSQCDGKDTPQQRLIFLFFNMVRKSGYLQKKFDEFIETECGNSQNSHVHFVSYFCPEFRTMRTHKEIKKKKEL